MTDTRLVPCVSTRDVTSAAPFAYQPALDGVRAVAVIAVVAFHAGAGWAPGGYLGVSVFFTLSGYLITSVLLAEHAATGRIALGGFVARRVRRLAPAGMMTLATLTLLAISGFGVAAAGSPRHLRWATAHIANWDQLTAESTYADAISGAVERSPVLHFWSLAIEEQFYLVWPVVMIAGLAIVRRRGDRHFVVVPGLALIVSWLFVASLARAGEAETIYLHSGSRAAELLTGCLLAAALRNRSSIVLPRLPLAQICAGLILIAVVVTGSSSDAWPYRGGLPLFALLSAGLIAGLARPSGFSAAMACRPLVWIGRRSYGIYLYHWPIFVLVPLVGAGLVEHAVRLLVVVALAAASYRWIEQPVRTRSTIAGPMTVLAVGAAAVVAATFLIDVGPAAILSTDDIDAGDRAAARIRDAPDPAPTAPLPPTPPPTAPLIADEPSSSLVTSDARRAPITRDDRPRVTEPAEEPPVEPPEPFRMVVVGDSTAVAMSAGLVGWAEESDGDVQVGIAAHGACGLVRGGRYIEDRFNAALSMTCPTLMDHTLPDLLDTARIDLVVVMVSLADTWERTWDDGATWSSPPDPAHAERVRNDYATFVEQVMSHGAGKVVFVRPPVAFRPDDLDEPLAQWSSGAQQVVDDTVAAIAAERTDVAVLDLRGFFEDSGFDADHSARPDGIHLTADASRRLADAWLSSSLRALRG